jgi:hypothetical protein
MLELCSYEIHAWTAVEAGSWVLFVEFRAVGMADKQKITYNLGPAHSGPIAEAMRLNPGSARDLLPMDRERAALKCGKIIEALLAEDLKPNIGRHG